MRDIDALSRRCKIYQLKRVVKFVIFPIVLLFAIGWSGWIVFDSSKNSTVHIEEKKTIEKKVIKDEVVLKSSTEQVSVVKQTKKSSSTSDKKKRFVSGVKVIQFVASSKKYFNTLKEEKKKFEQMGFSCYIKDSNDGFIKLRCLIPENFKQVSKVLKSRGIDFFLPTEEKEYLEKLSLKTSNISSLYVPKLEEKKVIKRDKKIAKEDTEKEIVKKTYSTETTPNENRVSSLIATKKATIDELISQYTHRPGFTRAIMIARAFYNKKEFKNAAKWAKRANSLDREREEGWILYAKSVNALGQRERAIKILKVYLNFKSSEEARKLLMQLERGMR